MKDAGPCLDCGRPPDEHGCHGRYRRVPDRCECDPRDWLVNPVPAICDASIKGEDPGQCSRCGHYEECHSERAK